MKKKIIKMGFRGTYGKIIIEKCPVCHKRKIEPFCQCPEEPLPSSPKILSVDIIAKCNEGGKLKSPIMVGYGKEKKKIFDVGIYSLGELRFWVIAEK